MTRIASNALAALAAVLITVLALQQAVAVPPAHAEARTAVVSAPQLA